MSGKIDWDPIQALAQRVVERGEPLELTDDVRALMRRSAREVAIPIEDVEQALRSPGTATALLRKISRRIEDGSWRLMVAKHRQDAGDLEGARQQMRDLLAVEVVPMYRRAAEENLAGLDEPPPPP